MRNKHASEQASERRLEKAASEQTRALACESPCAIDGQTDRRTDGRASEVQWRNNRPPFVLPSKNELNANKEEAK